MQAQETSDLYNQKQAVAFYEDRFAQGYMDDWPVAYKRKVFEVIQALRLPAQGKALDFGCGNGVFTEVLRQALPGWKVCGTDISSRALANAKTRYPDCLFFEAGSTGCAQQKFDFVFTNHVYEHVFNLSTVFEQMNGYLKPKSSMLHFLPCGNEGSYEYNICLLRKDGINAELENRFFFEDKGHVRRLTTQAFCALCSTKNFVVHKEFYSNQYHGAINWITNSNPQFIRSFSDTAQARNKVSERKLKQARLFLMITAALRRNARTVRRLLNKRDKHLKDYMLLLAGVPFFGLSAPVDRYWIRKAREEWETRKFDPKGSEMALYFKRNY